MVEPVPVTFGWPEIGLTALATAIIFYFLGGRVLRDFREGKFK